MHPRPTSSEGGRNPMWGHDFRLHQLAPSLKDGSSHCKIPGATSSYWLGGGRGLKAIPLLVSGTYLLLL